MIQVVSHTHELHSHDDVVEFVERVYQCDHGNIKLEVAIVKDGEPVDLKPYVVSVTNKAPNGEKLMLVADVDSPLTVMGNVVEWTLDKFDTQQVGTYLAQIHVATEDITATVVFVRYNVERSITGVVERVPVKYMTLTALAEQVKIYQRQAEALAENIEKLNGQYDVFQQILDESGISWDTLPSKPEEFPPSPHTHEQYELKTTVAALDERVVVNAEGISSLVENKADRAHVLEAVLWGSGWEGKEAPYTQVVEVPGMKEFGLYAVEYERSDVVSVQLARERQWGYIGTFKQEDGKVTAICSVAKPGVDYRLKFIYLGSEVKA